MVSLSVLPQPTPKMPDGLSSMIRETNSPAALPIWAEIWPGSAGLGTTIASLRPYSAISARSSRTQLSSRELMVMLTSPLLRASTRRRLTRSLVIFSRSAISAWVKPSM